MHRIPLFVAGLLLASPLMADPIKRASSPSISPDGRTLAFSYQNDIWVVPITGGEARRLTVHPAVDSNPRWMPDGQHIAFNSNRYGSIDVFMMDSEGGNLRRLNANPSDEYLYSVSPDGKLLFGYTTEVGRINLFCVDAIKGGDLVPMTSHPFELSYFPTPTADGKKVVYCLGGSPGNWRNPKEDGTDTAEIWVADLGLPLSKHVQITKNDNNDIFPLVSASQGVVFVSNRTGTPQIWKMGLDGKAPKQLTKHDPGTIRGASISPADLVAYEFNSDIYVLNLKTGKYDAVQIEVPADQLLNPMNRETLTTGASSFVVSPDGKRGIFEARGDLYLIPARGGTTRKLTSSLAKDYAPLWISNGQALFVTGRTGKRELWTVKTNGVEARFAADLDDLTNPILSPDGKWVACHRGAREIVLYPIAGGSPKVIGTGSFPGTYAGGPSFSWSPDSKWIAYENVTERGSTITMSQIETGQKLDVARVARGAGQPQFTKDGKTLVFESGEFEEVGLQAVSLVPEPVTFREDDLDKIDEPKPKEEPVVVQVDMNGIERRKRTLSDNASLLGIAPDGKTVWASQAGQLVAIPVSGGPATPVQGVAGITSVTFDSQKAYVVYGGKLGSMSLAGMALSPVAFSAAVEVDRRAEEVELFKEIWWAMDRMYYDADHHGQNWPAIKEAFSKLVPYCFDRQDFYALMREMIELIDSSHLSIGNPPSPFAVEQENAGSLGVDWEPVALATKGFYVVDKVLIDTPADQASSRLMKGDRILSVDDAAISKESSLSSNLVGKVGKKVRLKVERSGKIIDIDIKPSSLGSTTAARYEQFIIDRRKEALSLSGGTCTYFHVQGMNTPSTDRLFRDVRNLGEGKSGAIVDVRWNGGGNTANRILAAMRADKWLERRFRSNPRFPVSEEIFRGEAFEMPLVLMTNQYSASNAEIFSEGFRQMKLGAIVGEATGGNVLTVAGQYRLWDGGGVQVPFIGIYTVNGESLEGPGRKVDVDVRYDPNAWNEGRDNQLEAAVKALMKEVSAKRK